jgi:hypothetical protein
MNKIKVSNIFLKLNIFFSVIAFIVLFYFALMYFYGTKDDLVSGLLISLLGAFAVNPLGFICGILSLCVEMKYKLILKIFLISSSIILEIIFLWWPFSYIF